MVHWVLFPIVGLLLGLTLLKHTGITFFLFALGFNILIVTSILTILWLYTTFIRKRVFLNTSFGLGDILFLYAFALGFPPFSFIILLASSICFSILAFVVLRYFKKEETIPLAGFMGVFLSVTLILSFVVQDLSPYLI